MRTLDIYVTITKGSSTGTYGCRVRTHPETDELAFTKALQYRELEKKIISAIRWCWGKHKYVIKEWKLATGKQSPFITQLQKQLNA